ncbi:MAG: HD domain-containing protein [Bacteroidales bacterium]|nr:HD domain-containing protein [Bacteroidales bacterium]
MQKKYDIRKATEQDIDLILKMFDHSRTVMRQDGNHAQWVGYPTRADVAEDVRRGVAYVIENLKLKIENYQFPNPDNPYIGTFALVPGEEPTYGYIDHGRWIDERTPYCTLHRVAAMPGTSGVAEAVFRYIKDACTHLRVDTHALNRPMRHILEKEGFVYCGIIYMPDGGPRDAYEWWRWDEVPADLKQYVENEVLPRHEKYDAAHRPDHIRRVIARSMFLLPNALTYAAAAMHDIGIGCGREEHHLHSGRIIREDKELRRWFSEEEVELIAQAAEDHRASATRAPRSLLGCIVAEADRDIEPETIVRRTVEYGISHYPTLDREGHWQRTLEHLHEKYAEGGYIKLWLEESPNAAPLAELRALIADEGRLRALFDSLFDALTNENKLKNQNS